MDEQELAERQRKIEWQYQKRKERVANGLCAVCGKKLDYTSKWYCKKHLLMKREVSKRNDKRKNNIITTTQNGKVIRLKVKNKRPHPGKCEVCGRENRLSYHHWDNLFPHKGIWLCSYCHAMAERVDQDFVDKYIDLKEKINAS